ncbi:hypothetical protein V6N12_017347 [Hibiscus sabdariffa]|uniref:RNase H type-1 domain-containing protein n=1 Tax=Hibiscus sabdariffa TaxID=183260 RepID=A0ABR2CGZ0_9ROSI
MLQDYEDEFDNFTLITHILKLMNRSWFVQLNHVKRWQNCLADRSAKPVMADDLLCHRFLEPPSDCLQQLQIHCASDAHEDNG